MNEERDVPDLGTLLQDIAGMQERFDATAAANKDNPEELARVSSAFIQNDMLPWLKDFVESTLFGFEDIQDMVNPIKVSGGDAQSITELLLSMKAANPGNPELLAKIDDGLEALEADGPDDGDETEEEEEQEESGERGPDDEEEDEDDDDLDEDDEDDEDDEEEA